MNNSKNLEVKTNLDELINHNKEFYQYLKSSFHSYRYEISNKRVKVLLNPVFVIGQNNSVEGFIDLVETEFLNDYLENIINTNTNIGTLYVIDYKTLTSKFLN